MLKCVNWLWGRSGDDRSGLFSDISLRHVYVWAHEAADNKRSARRGFLPPQSRSATTWRTIRHVLSWRSAGPPVPSYRRRAHWVCKAVTNKRSWFKTVWLWKLIRRVRLTRLAHVEARARRSLCIVLCSYCRAQDWTSEVNTHVLRMWNHNAHREVLLNYTALMNATLSITADL